MNEIKKGQKYIWELFDEIYCHSVDRQIISSEKLQNVGIVISKKTNEKAQKSEPNELKGNSK